MRMIPARVSLQRALGFRYQPEFYLLDGSGQILHKWIGLVSESEFEAEFANQLTR